MFSFIWNIVCSISLSSIIINGNLLKKVTVTAKTLQWKLCIFKLILNIWMLLLNHKELWQFIFFQEIFNKNSQIVHLYCFWQYGNIRNIHVKYSYCGPNNIKSTTHTHIFIKNNFSSFTDCLNRCTLNYIEVEVSDIIGITSFTFFALTSVHWIIVKLKSRILLGSLHLHIVSTGVHWNILMLKFQILLGSLHLHFFALTSVHWIIVKLKSQKLLGSLHYDFILTDVHWIIVKLKSQKLLGSLHFNFYLNRCTLNYSEVEISEIFWIVPFTYCLNRCTLDYSEVEISEIIGIASLTGVHWIIVKLKYQILLGSLHLHIVSPGVHWIIVKLKPEKLLEIRKASDNLI